MPPIRTDNPPRPSNCFMIYRKKRFEEYKTIFEAQGRLLNQQELSRLIGKDWKALSPEEREEYEESAKEAAEAHRLLYPDYVYAPEPKAVKAQRRDEEAKERAKEKVKAKAIRLPSSSGASSHDASSSAVVSGPVQQPLQCVYYPNAPPPTTRQFPYSSAPLHNNSAGHTRPAVLTEDQIRQHWLFSRGNALAAANQGFVEGSSSALNTPAIPPGRAVQGKNTTLADTQANTLANPIPAVDHQVNHTFPSASNDVDSGSSSDSNSPVYDDDTFEVPGSDAVDHHHRHQVDPSIYIPSSTSLFAPYPYPHMYEAFDNYRNIHYASKPRPITAEEEAVMAEWLNYD